MSRTSDLSDCQPDVIDADYIAPNIDTDEEEIFAKDACLYKFSFDKDDWLGRGNGVLKILKNNETGTYRLLMRQSRTYKLRINHLVPYFGNLKVCQKSDRQFMWSAYDSVMGEEERGVFAVRFATPEIATAFQSAFVAGQEANKAIVDK